MAERAAEAEWKGSLAERIGFMRLGAALDVGSTGAPHEKFRCASGSRNVRESIRVTIEEIMRC
jgi:hypothetical protein